MRTTTTRFAIGITALLAAAGTTAAAPLPGPGDGAAVDAAYRLRMDGRSDDAEDMLERALAADAGSAAAWKEMARVQFYHLDFDAAAGSIERAIALEADDDDAHELAGVIASYRAVWLSKRPETRGDVPAAIRRALDELERAVTLDSTNGRAGVQLVSLYLNSEPEAGGDRRRAAAVAAKLEAADPVAGTAARCLVDSAASDTDRIARWDRLVAARPDDAAARAGLARAYLGAANPAGARPHVEAAIAQDPSQRRLLIDLGRGYALGEDLEQAEATFRRYLDADPAPPAPMRSTVTFFVAVVRKRQGQAEAAEVLLDEAKAIDPRGWRFFREPPEILFRAP